MAIWLLAPSIRCFRAPSVNSLNSSASSSASSTISNTSTLEYGHEEFITFESKVRDLIHLIPHLSISLTTSIEVTRMPGGLNYRIIGVKIIPETPKTKTKKGGKSKGKGKNKIKFRPATDGAAEVRNYILRLPRKEKNNGTRMDREVAVLYYIEKCTTIPVPKTIAFDLEGVNGCPVGLPYILQTRITGVPLDEAFNQMTFGQKKRFVCKLVDLYVKMDKVRFSRAGVLGPSPKLNCAAIEVESFDLDPGTGENQKYRSYAQQTTRDMLLSQFESWKIAADDAPRSLGESELVSGYMDKLILVTLQMEKFSCLGDDSNTLFHPDLSPRNIFVTCTGADDLGEWDISGVLDWESALSVPRVMANRAPSWLWRWGAEEGYDESDEKADGNVPEDSERAELKRLFEVEMEAALPLFIGYAYRPCFRMLRRLCRFAVWGVRWKEDVDRVVEFLREWKELVADPFAE